MHSCLYYIHFEEYGFFVSLTVSGLDYNTKYFFRVRAIRTKSNKTVKGKWSDKESAKMTLEPTKISKIAEGKKTTVKWKAQTNADGYLVQYADNLYFKYDINLLCEL